MDYKIEMSISSICLGRVENEDDFCVDGKWEEVERNG